VSITAGAAFDRPDLQRTHTRNAPKQALRIQRKIQEEGSFTSGGGPSDSRVSLARIGPLPPTALPANRLGATPTPSILGVSLPSAVGGIGNSRSQGGQRNQPMPGLGIGALPSLFPRQQPTGITLAVDEEFNASRRGAPSSGLPAQSLVRPAGRNLDPGMTFFH